MRGGVRAEAADRPARLPGRVGPEPEGSRSPRTAGARGAAARGDLERDLLVGIGALLEEAGMEGSVHARVLGRPDIVEIRREEGRVLPAASLYKLPLVVAFVRAVDAGALDPREQVRLEPGERTRGGTGLSVLQDPVSMSWRDLAKMAVTVSDNAAGDALLARLGAARLEEMLDELGLSDTHVRGGARLTLDLLAQESARSVVTPADVHVGPDSSALDPHLVSVTSAADMLRLVELLWSDRAASGPGCEFVRLCLSQQVWAHRFAGAFSYPGVSIAAKTGSLGPLRHEVGAVSHSGEPPVLISVLTKSARRDSAVPRADAVLGAVAGEVVQFLRQFI